MGAEQATKIRQALKDAQGQIAAAGGELANVNFAELTPNADELLVAYADGGQKALDLANQALTMVSDFLDSLGD
jgi:hypothetical protein